MDDVDILNQLSELQSQLAFQDDTIAALNDALAQQQRELLTLRRQLELLKQRQDEQAAALDQGSEEAAPALERPPHY